LDVIESSLEEKSWSLWPSRRLSQGCIVGVGECERKARRVGGKGRDRGTPRATDAAKSENIDAGVEAPPDHRQ
jgi:hypothetical protein